MKIPKCNELERYNRHFYYYSKDDKNTYGSYDIGCFVAFDYENDCMKVFLGKYKSENKNVIKELKGLI